MVGLEKVALKFLFVPKPNETQICHPWLAVQPQAGMLLPRDKMEIRVWALLLAGVVFVGNEGKRSLIAHCCGDLLLQLTVNITRENAAVLNQGTCIFEDILILHLKNGRDHFIQVQGNFFRSSFGNSLDTLVRIHGPVRYAKAEEFAEDQSGTAAAAAAAAITRKKKLKLPKELWRLVDFLFRHGMDAVRTCS